MVITEILEQYGSGLITLVELRELAKKAGYIIVINPLKQED